VDTDGNVLKNSLQGFTEEDTLTVVAVGPRSAVAGLKITRRSAFRDVTVLRILGDTGGLAIGGAKQGGKPEDIVCKRVQLADFPRGAARSRSPPQR
jgi:hypothetical protein